MQNSPVLAPQVPSLDARRGSLTGRVTAAAASAWAVRKSPGRAGQIIRFSWHFVEMAIAMEIGMMPLGLVLGALGQADLNSRSPELYALAMTVSMVLPMAAWMLVRRHAWQRTAEMVAAMIVPIAVLAAGGLAGLVPHHAAVSGMGSLMWLSMLAAMLFRWRDYAQHHHGGHGQ